MARFAVAVLVVGPAAVCMGGTFPVLGEHLARGDPAFGRRATALYAANAAGAACGVLAATFWLPATWGWRITWGVGAGIALLVGSTAIVAGRDPLPRAPPQPPGTGTSPHALAGLAFASGALALALQVLWIRMFAQAYPNSVYVFGSVLGVFLVALALGAAVAHGLARRRLPGRATLAVVLGAAAALVAGTGPAFHALTGGLAPPPPGLPWSAYVGRLVGSVALVLGLPVVAVGVFLPWLMRMAEGGRDGAGRVLGRLRPAPPPPSASARAGTRRPPPRGVRGRGDRRPRADLRRPPTARRAVVARGRPCHVEGGPGRGDHGGRRAEDHRERRPARETPSREPVRDPAPRASAPRTTTRTVPNT